MSLADLAAWKRYFWPGTEILRNKLDIRDADRLAEAEALLTRIRIEQGVPVLKGTRVPVRVVADLVKKGATAKDLEDEFDVALAQGRVAAPPDR